MPAATARNPKVAAILSLLTGTPIGQLYAGHFRRGFFIWLITGIALPIGLLLLWLLPFGRTALVCTFIAIIATPIVLACDAYKLARRQPPGQLKRYQRWWIYVAVFIATALFASLLADLFRKHVLEAFVIPSYSMAPTILPGDRITVNKLVKSFPKRNDVVVFYSEGPGSELYVMRVIGLPGETISIRNEDVFVDGKRLEDSHAHFDKQIPIDRQVANLSKTTVPPDSFFVMGDNRRNTRDSRVLGSIPFRDYYGKAHVIYWSRERNRTDPWDSSKFKEGSLRWQRSGVLIK